VAELKAAAAAELGGLAVTDLVDQGKARACMRWVARAPRSLHNRGTCVLCYAC